MTLKENTTRQVGQMRQWTRYATSFYLSRKPKGRIVKGDMQKRAKAKLIRRQKILAAAQQLIRETGSTSLSMRVLARIADVSITAPYEIFGSKGGVLLALLDESSTKYLDYYASHHQGAPFELLFDAAIATHEFLQADGEFHRSLLQILFALDRTELRAALTGPRLASITAHVSQMIRMKVIAPSVAPSTLGALIDQLFFAAILNWVLGDSDLDQMEAELHYGIASILCGLCTAEYAIKVETRRLDWQAKLLRLHRKEVNPQRQLAADRPARGRAGPSKSEHTQVKTTK